MANYVFRFLADIRFKQCINKINKYLLKCLGANVFVIKLRYDNLESSYDRLITIIIKIYNLYKIRESHLSGERG